MWQSIAQSFFSETLGRKRDDDMCTIETRRHASVLIVFWFSNLDDILIGQRFVRLVVLGVLEQHLVHVSRRVLVEPVGTAEDDQRNLAVAQHRQFVGFLHDAKFALIERHLQFLYLQFFLEFFAPFFFLQEKKC